MPIDFPDMMNVVVVNDVVLVHVLCAGTITAKQNTTPAQMFDVVAGNFVFLAMQVHPDRPAAAVKKMALFNHAVLGPAHAHEGVALVEHIPVVLRPGIVLGQGIALAMLEGETAETKVAHRNILWALLINGPFDEEKLDSYEIGIKGELLERRLRFSTVGFYQKFKDYQYNFQIPGTISGTRVFNIDKGEMSGVELELTALPTAGLLLQASYAYLDSKLDAIENPFTGTTESSTFTNAPENTYSLIADYTWPATSSHRSDVAASPAPYR